MVYKIHQNSADVALDLIVSSKPGLQTNLERIGSIYFV